MEDKNVQFFKPVAGSSLAFACATSHGEVHYAYALAPKDGAALEPKADIFRPVGGAYRVDTTVAGGVALLPLPNSLGRSTLVVTFINTTSEEARGSFDVSFRRGEDQHEFKRTTVEVSPSSSRTFAVYFLGI